MDKTVSTITGTSEKMDEDTSLALGIDSSVEMWRIPAVVNANLGGSPMSLGNSLWMTVSEQLDLVSDSADDDGSLGNAGAWDIFIEGLDANGEPLTEIIQLTGLAPVTTVNIFWGIRRITVMTTGVGLANAGNISVSGNVTATDVAYLPLTTNRRMDGIFAPRLDKKMVVHSTRTYTESSATPLNVGLEFWYLEPGGVPTYLGMAAPGVDSPAIGFQARMAGTQVWWVARNASVAAEITRAEVVIVEYPD